MTSLLTTVANITTDIIGRTPNSAKTTVVGACALYSVYQLSKFGLKRYRTHTPGVKNERKMELLDRTDGVVTDELANGRRLTVITRTIAQLGSRSNRRNRAARIRYQRARRIEHERVENMVVADLTARIRVRFFQPRKIPFDALYRFIGNHLADLNQRGVTNYDATTLERLAKYAITNALLPNKLDLEVRLAVETQTARARRGLLVADGGMFNNIVDFLFPRSPPVDC